MPKPSLFESEAAARTSSRTTHVDARCEHIPGRGFDSRRLHLVHEESLSLTRGHFVHRNALVPYAEIPITGADKVALETVVVGPECRTRLGDIGAFLKAQGFDRTLIQESEIRG